MANELLIQKNLQKFKEIQTSEIEAKIQDILKVEKNFKEIKCQLLIKLSEMKIEGPPLDSQNLLLTPNFQNEHYTLDNYLSRNEFKQRQKYIKKLREYSQYQPEYLIPAPEEVPLQPDEFLTPFPIFLESPTLNPCIRRE